MGIPVLYCGTWYDEKRHDNCSYTLQSDTPVVYSMFPVITGVRDGKRERSAVWRVFPVKMWNVPSS